MSEQGKIWAAFIESQLQGESDRRTTLEAKALAVVTSSGTLVTLVFAIGALAIGRKDANFVLQAQAVIPAVVGLVLFVLSSATALLARMGLSPYSVASSRSLEKLRATDLWKYDEVDARNIVCWFQIKTIETLRAVNNYAARLLSVSLSLQILATLALATAIGLALLTAVEAGSAALAQ